MEKMVVSDRRIAIAGLVLTTLGIPFSIYLFRKSILRPIPTFLIDPVRATIVDSSRVGLSDLSVLYKGKPVGFSGVTAIRVYVWNAGNQAIRSSDVLEPLQCVFPKGVQILESRILKVTRPEITKVQAPTPERNVDRVIIGFNILEPDDGATIQITYAGPDYISITPRGVVIGAKSPVVRHGEPEDTMEFQIWIFSLVAILLITPAEPAGVLIDIVQRLRKRPRSRPRTALSYVSVTTALFIFAFMMVHQPNFEYRGVPAELSVVNSHRPIYPGSPL